MVAIARPELAIGVHDGIPDRDYHALPYCSSSRIKVLEAKTPAHLRYEMDHPREPSPAMKLGAAVHCLVLTPSRYMSTYAVAPDVDRRTKDGKAAYAEFAAGAIGKTIIDAKTDMDARDIACKALGNPLLASALRICTRRELTLIAEVEGVRCKMRLDGYGQPDEKSGLVLDLKTTQSAARSDFERSIGNFGYGIQAAMYWRGCVLAKLHVTDFLWAVVETEGAHLTAIYRMEDEVIETYGRMLAPHIKKFDECIKSGIWPGYPPTVTEIGIPKWLRRQLEDGIEAVRG